MVQSVEHRTLDLLVVKLEPQVGHRDYLKTNNLMAILWSRNQNLYQVFDLAFFFFKFETLDICPKGLYPQGKVCEA